MAPAVSKAFCASPARKNGPGAVFGALTPKRGKLSARTIIKVHEVAPEKTLAEIRRHLFNKCRAATSVRVMWHNTSFYCDADIIMGCRATDHVIMSEYARTRT